jgi:hypothetical protein
VLTGAALQLPSGAGAAGETLPAGAQPTLALVARAFPTARRLFPEVQPVPVSVWQPVQRRQVRYHLGPAGSQTMEVHIIGRQQPVILPQRGVPRRAPPPAAGTPGAAPTPGSAGP